MAYNPLDKVNCIANVGYWLGKEHTGKGIMLRAVSELLYIGFQYWPIQKVEIQCAETNTKSKVIPGKLGFKNEGLIRRAANVSGSYQNHYVFGLLKEKYFANQQLHRTPHTKRDR